MAMALDTNRGLIAVAGLAAIVVLFVLLAVGMARAGEAAVRRDCAADAIHHCPGDIAAYAVRSRAAGRAALVRCMVRHRAQRSPACARHIK